jgi:hypothetical protein
MVELNNVHPQDWPNYLTHTKAGLASLEEDNEGLAELPIANEDN